MLFPRVGNLQYKVANKLKTVMIELDPANKTLGLPLTLDKLSLFLSYKVGHQRETHFRN